MPIKEEYHKILGIEGDASPEEIKQAYRNMAKKYHPDINKAPDAHERFIEITEAYEILMNRDLHEYYLSRDRTVNKDFMRAHYERAREAAKESAHRYARMKFEKFQHEQEAFKKSGWHDMILTIRYILRVLAFPFVAFCIAIPLISEEVSEHPTGYIIFWLIAMVIIGFIISNWKNYLKIDTYYYHLSDLAEVFRGISEATEKQCYYCEGKKAMRYPYRISMFHIKKIQMQDFGTLHRPKAGVSRDQKTVRIPRSRKAFIVHSIVSLIKFFSLLFCLSFFNSYPVSRLSIIAGLALGAFLSAGILLLFNTKPKVSYFLSYGMLIKILIWVVLIWFLGGYAFIYLFFDPMVEALLRFISADRLFVPILKQHPELDKLFKKQFQVYMELPVLSVAGPLLRWFL